MAALVSNSSESGVGRIHLHEGSNIVGRAEGNHHVIPHASVSGRHCEVTLQDHAITVRDLGSTNGTFVNNQPVQQATVGHAQRLRFGSIEFLVEAPELQPASSRLRVTLASPAAPPRDEPPVQGQTVAAAIAAIDPVQYQPASFYSQIPESFAYPFKGSGIILLVTGALLFAVLDFFSSPSRLFPGIYRVHRVTGIFWVFSTGYLFSYMQRIIAHSAQGDDEAPGWPEFSEWWSDILQPCLFLVATVVISFGPGVALLFFVEENPMVSLAAFAALAVGAFYFPMALLAMAVSDNVVALSPHIVVPSILRVFVPYFVSFLLLAMLVGVGAGIEAALDLIPIPVLPFLISSFVSLYLIAVEMRLLGLLFRCYRHRLGWLS